MDLKAIGVARKYTDESIQGITGTLAGKNCTIESIEPVEGGNKVTFLWTADNGDTQRSTLIVMDGEGIPLGGTKDQILAKASDADGDLKWIDNQGGGGGGTNNYNLLSNLPQINGNELKGNKTTEDLIPIGTGLEFDEDGKLKATGGGGLLPYLYIDSETGSTVTVVAPDSTVITPTQTGSGHWECEVPDYGIYVIHSVLAGQGDATLSLTVDDVKEYHVTDSHYDFTINVTADVGASIRVEAGAETYTKTGTGSPVAFVVHQASTQYTVTETLDGYTDVKTVTSASVTGESVNVTLHVFAATLSISTNSSELFGQVIVISKSGTIVGSTSFTDSGQASYVVHETGTFTLTCTYQGQSYSEDVPVSAETTYPVQIDTIPEGSTVLPTDDIQTWLKCAGIRDKSYTMLSEVLADHDTLYILMGDDNAVDYLVRSTTWTTDITADEYAMKYIGKWNYASSALLDDSTWRAAIIDSTYQASILNTSVPTMTGLDAPSGHVTAGTASTTNVAWYAFDKNSSTFWAATNQTQSGSTSVEDWIGYEFPSAVRCAYAVYNGVANTAVQTWSVKGSNDGTNFVTLASGTTLSSQTNQKLVFTENVDEYKYYRLYLTQKWTGGGPGSFPRVIELQYYGRSDVTEGIDVYGAASDTMTVTGNGITLTITTDSSGHYIVPKTSLPNGTYTFTSGVAKDPTNLSNDYTKTVTITEGTSEVYVMPDGEVLYWYGYKPNEFVAYAYQASGVSRGVNAPTISQSGTDLRIAQAQKSDYPGGIATTNVLYDVTNYTKIKAIGKTNAHSLAGTPRLTSAIQNNYTMTSTSAVNYSSDNVYECVYSTPNSGVTQGYVLINVNCGSSAVVALNLSALWLE